VPSQNPNRLRPTAPMGNNTPAANGNGATQESPTPLEPAFSIRVSETGVVSEDKNRFEDVIRLLLNYKGDHPFILQVETGERIVTLEMPFAIQPCDELVTNLSELIGSENILISEMADAAAV